MYYWVTVSKEDAIDIYFGEEAGARKAAQKALYGPYVQRREARGCTCDLQSTEPIVRAIPEKKRVQLEVVKLTASVPVASETDTENTAEPVPVDKKPVRKGKKADTK